MSTRRQILAGILANGWPALASAKSRRMPRMLVRACWQSFSMGEVAQVAGLLRFLAEELPRVSIVLWATNLEHGVGPWLQHHFPQLSLVTGTTGRDGLPDQPALAKAWHDCDFLLHGPAGKVVARDHLEAWRKHTGKPFGLFGVTTHEIDEKLQSLLLAAAFVWVRDGISHANLAKLGVNDSKLGFFPDPAFLLPQRDQVSADRWLTAHHLLGKRFLCVVTKLRFTPYWSIYGRAPKYAEIVQAQENERFQASDHELFVETLIHCLRVPDLQILICPEMPYEVEIGQQLLQAKLPQELQSRCQVRTTLCLPDEAAAIFAQAQAVLSYELLSCVVAASAGTPALHVRLPHETHQGQMWRDVGLKQWIADRDQTTARTLADQLHTLLTRRFENEAKLAEMSKFITECQQAAGAALRKAMGLATNGQ